MAGRTGSRDARMARGLLVVVGAAYLVAQLLLFPSNRAPSWDEAIYLSQMTPRVDAIAFAPSRARGISLLVSPITMTGGSIRAVRLFLAALSSVAVVGSFLLWVPALGLGAPVAAFLFASTWVGLFYGSEVMPNLWAAVLAVAVAGAFVRRVEDRASWAAIAAGVLVGLMALVRPADALVLGGALALYVLLFRRSSSPELVSVGAGLAIGWGAWLVEMSVRFGGPARAIREAAALGHLTALGVGERVLQNLALTNGPTIGPEAHPHVPIAGVLWWGTAAALTGVAVVRRRSPMRGAVLCAVLGGSALAAEYLVLVSSLAPRFLLPAYALLSLPAATGLISLLTGGAARRIGGAAAVAVLAGLTAWHVGTARTIGNNAAAARDAVASVGVEVRGRAAGDACVVASAAAFPQLAFASRCAGRGLAGIDAASLAALRGSVSPSERLFVVLPTSPPAGSPLASMPAASVEGWFVFELPAAP
jgi:4-amino-4-deoxy-L-arabinose transferase-like glycosyltransferase